MSETLAEVAKVYEGSNGDATLALYKRLEALGPVGHIAMNLFRACKASERAKVYRGGIRGRGSYRRMAYDRKAWAMDNLCKALGEHAAALGVIWGWGLDEKTEGYKHVLYVDLPTGQASFHTGDRGEGPDHPTGWNGSRASAHHIICWTARLLDQEKAA